MEENLDASRTSEDTAMDSNTATFLEATGPNLRRPYITEEGIVEGWLRDPLQIHKVAKDAVMEDQRGQFAPAGWKHPVFTLESGYLVGYSFCTHERLQQHVNILLCELHAAIRCTNQSETTQEPTYFPSRRRLFVGVVLFFPEHGPSILPSSASAEGTVDIQFIAES
jgi:hypothetical protein